MRILFLSTWYPFPADNGSKLRVYHLIKALGSRHNVTLLSLTFGTADPETGQHVLQGVCSEVHTVPCNPFEHRQSARLFRYFSPIPAVNSPLPAMKSLLQQIVTESAGYDVLIASTLGMAGYEKLLPATIIRVLEEHNSLSRQMWERFQAEARSIQRFRNWVSWHKTRNYEAAVLKSFHLTTMVSEQDRQATLTMLPGYGGPVSVVPNGVDCQHNRLGLVSPSSNTLVFNGPLTYQANYDGIRWFLAKVYPLIKNSHPEVRLVITGSLENVDLAGLAVDNSVQLTGYLDDVRSQVASGTVAIAPLLQGGGTRLKILEAMALGVPVVATYKGAEGLDVNDEEHILLAYDPIRFSEQVNRLLVDEGLRYRIIQTARLNVEQKYNWTHIGTRFADLIEGLVI